MTKTYSYIRCGLMTSWNIIYNAASLGRRLWLEGGVHGEKFSNWAKNYNYRPKKVAYPTTEEQIIDLVKTSSNLRLFGSGHSFNPAVVTDGTLISLDRYTGVIHQEGNLVRVRAGTRMRDLTALLASQHQAFRGLPSHDAQSIGGILSTDVHGTGKNWGFVSELVTGLTVIDGLGKVHRLVKDDALFQAAIGGIGAVGIITEVEVEVVEQFFIEQKVEVSTVSAVTADFEKLYQSNEHMSFYFFPFTQVCQVNTWNEVDTPVSRFGALREFLAISQDALMAAWIGNLVGYWRLLPAVSNLAHKIRKGTDLVLPSAQAFNRTIYPLHQEFEFTVPMENWASSVKQFIALYESHYREQGGLPYALLEVRFTPDKTNTMIGAGRGERCWIDIIINDCVGVPAFYKKAEELVRSLNARPHLGKWLGSIDADYMRQAHERFDEFLKLRSIHDPDGKFLNEQSRRLFIEKTT